MLWEERSSKEDQERRPEGQAGPLATALPYPVLFADIFYHLIFDALLKFDTWEGCKMVVL